MRVVPEDYLNRLVDYAMMKIYAVATVKETQQTWSEEDDFIVEKPRLIMEVRGKPVVGQPFGLEIRLTNPLQRALTNCVFSIEGPGLARATRTNHRDIGPGETISYVERLVPAKPGPRNILVIFGSRELNDVQGSKQVNVL